MQVKFVINGEPVEVAIDPEAPLRNAVQQVLQQSSNTGRPFEDWELRDDRGRLLSTDRSFADHAWLTANTNNYLFVTARVGVGGNTPHAPGWVEYSARNGNGDKHVERAIYLNDPNALALALKCSDPDVCLDIFGDAHEFTPGSDFERVASWSFYLHDLYRLGLDIVVRYVSDVDMSARHAPPAVKLNTWQP